MINQTAPVSASSNPAATCIHGLFERVAATRPDRVALVHGGEEISYAELNARANRIAHYLRSRGVGPETPVALALERSPEQIACLLGVLKAGGAYLPLDLAAPRERLAAVVADAEAPLVLTNSALAARLPVDESRLIRLDRLDLRGLSAADPHVPCGPANLAYVMFTSGSTGRPKGVMIEHRAVVRLVRETDYADFGADHVFLQFAPLTFDASTFEIWGALLNGARLAIMPEGLSSLADLGRAIREHGVTTLWLTAGLFHLMVDERLDDLRPLRQLLAGGDVLSATHVQKLLDRLDCALINGYGPTENTTFSCTYKVPRSVALGNTVPIGRPIAGTQALILDAGLAPVPDGEAGELYLGGDGLARGYLNRDELTAERFVPNPFPEISSARLYRSGDLARRRADGNLEFLGRVDRQLKIRGFRIEPEEIETALARQDGIREAAVAAQDGAHAEKRLVAFVVPEAGRGGADIARWRRGLEETLPAYMIPSLILPLAALPLTANGKVDRARLLDLLEAGAARPAPLDEPGLGDERKIAAILEEILGRGPVGARENFFDLGATSLQIARFHSRLQTAFDAGLKIVTLYQNPTVGALARALGGGDAAENGAGLIRARALRQREAYARRRRQAHGEN